MSLLYSACIFVSYGTVLEKQCGLPVHFRESRNREIIDQSDMLQTPIQSMFVQPRVGKDPRVRVASHRIDHEKAKLQC